MLAMPRTTITPLPPEVGLRLTALGTRIRDARLHRKFRQIDVATRTGLSRSTIEAVERGSPETAIGAYARVLWLMGLDGELEIVADPALDREGAALEYRPGERRVLVRKGLNNDF
jgi:transcriptional regulator with XRE-family HTH domain